MKDFVKYAAVGVAGYLIGFYEMKYKTAMALMKVLTEKNQEDSNEEKEEEAQASFFLFLVKWRTMLLLKFAKFTFPLMINNIKGGMFYENITEKSAGFIQIQM